MNQQQTCRRLPTPSAVNNKQYAIKNILDTHCTLTVESYTFPYIRKLPPEIDKSPEHIWPPHCSALIRWSLNTEQLLLTDADDGGARRGHLISSVSAAARRPAPRAAPAPSVPRSAGFRQQPGGSGYTLSWGHLYNLGNCELTLMENILSS